MKNRVYFGLGMNIGLGLIHMDWLTPISAMGIGGKMLKVKCFC